MAEDLRILLIDDSAGDRALASALLRDELEGVQIREVDGALDFAEVLGYRSWTVAVAERELSWGNGAEVLRALKQRHPRCLTILFTRSSPDTIGTVGGRSGVDGYIYKESDGYLRLPAVIREARHSSRYGGGHTEPVPEGLRGALDAIAPGYFLTLSDGTILKANAALARLLGTGASDRLVDTRLTDRLVDPAERARCERAMLRGTREPGILASVRPDHGRDRPLVLSFWPVPDPDGRACLEGLVWEPPDAAGDARPAPEVTATPAAVAAGRAASPIDGGRTVTSPATTNLAAPDPAPPSPVTAVDSAPIGPLALRSALIAAARQLEPSVTGAGIRLRVGSLPELYVNRSEITRLFRELIDNAVRYRSEAKPEISVRAEPQAQGWLISVQDNGAGIAPSERSALVETLASNPGSGLGICRQIAVHYGGELWITSQPRKGTTVFVALNVSGRHPQRTRLSIRLNGQPVGRIWVKDPDDDREIARAALAVPAVRRDMTGRTIRAVERREGGEIDIRA